MISCTAVFLQLYQTLKDVSAFTTARYNKAD